MDRLADYRAIIRNKLLTLADFINEHLRTNRIRAHAVIDEERDQYLLVKTGWDNNRRVRGTTLYLQIKDGQVWIEEDWTEEGISAELVEAGIAEDDIILAFQSPEPRALSHTAS